MIMHHLMAWWLHYWHREGGPGERGEGGFSSERRQRWASRGGCFGGVQSSGGGGWVSGGGEGLRRWLGGDLRQRQGLERERDVGGGERGEVERVRRLGRGGGQHGGGRRRGDFRQRL